MQKTLQIGAGWLLATDPENVGKDTGMASFIPDSALPAPVPGIIQQVFTSYHGVAWYYLKITPDLVLKTGENEFPVLHFGAVDYFCEVFLDGEKVGQNEGAENEFDVDVTGKWKEGSLLALRVINPVSGREIDGFTMENTPHRNKADGPFHCGACYNSGGITLPVTLQVRSALRICDCFVRADWQSGEVDLEITLFSCLNDPTDAILTASARLSEATQNEVETTVAITAPRGETVLHLGFKIPDFKLWDIDSPNVYELSLTIESAKTDLSAYQTHFGFRDFRLKNGYFHLNGRRIFLKSAHTGNHMPEGLALPAPTMPELEYKDFQLSKAAGFNCIRFIATQATPRQLDYCDRLGLMIYQETYASWLLEDSDQAKRRYDESILAQVRRDRNHPSLTIWGTLNETKISDAHFAARDILPKIRELDDTRLVIFSSGRFDIRHSMYPNDPDFVPDTTLGSAANPESSVWEDVWGIDGIPYEQLKDVKIDYNLDGYRFYVGDYHHYPRYPHVPQMIDHFRTYAHNTKPTFISEYGVGSLLNVIDHCLEFEQHGTDKTAPDYLLMRSISERYIADFERFGFENTFSQPVDLLRESEKYNAISRRDGMDLVRSNPKFVGYNMTGLLDHAICGEGPYTLFRRIKTCNYDAISEGFAPIRFCLFFETGGKVNQGCQIYSGEEMTFEAVLADEDLLKNGEYSAFFAISDEDGAPISTWESSFTLPQIGDDGLRLMAYPVTKKTLKIEGKPGKYIFRAYLKNGASPVACEKEFFVSERPVASLGRKVALLGLPDKVADRVKEYGCDIVSKEDAQVILVGRITPEMGEDMMKLTEKGAKAAFIDAWALVTSNGYGSFLPLPDYKVEPEQIWLYHTDIAVRKDPLTEGLKRGFADWRRYFGMIATLGLTTSRTPDRVGAAHFYLGGPTEYHSSLVLSVFAHGKGEIVISTFPMLAEMGNSPAVDRLLINLLKE